MQTVRLGDRGEDVRYAQQRLNVHGANPRLVEDGIFGNGTDGAARQFQDDNGLAVDGIIGSNTWQKLEEDPEGQVRPPCMGNGLRVSAWSNRKGSQWLASMSEWCDLAHRMGISEVALMLDEQTDGGWTLGKYGGDPERVVKVCEGLRSNGITPVLVTWPVPKREQLDLVIAEFIDLVHAGAARVGEFDIEGGNWSSKYVEGFDDLDHAARYLGEHVTEQAKTRGVALATDTHLGRMTASNLVLNLPTVHGTSGANELFAQAYSKYEEDEPDRWWGAKYGPGNMQREAHEKMQAVQRVMEPYAMPMAYMGLAAWNQRYPEHAGNGRARSGEESIIESISACVELGVYDIRFWSWKHCMNNDYVGNALREAFKRWGKRG